jgi:uncharacterized Zn-finger protein
MDYNDSFLGRGVTPNGWEFYATQNGTVDGSLLDIDAEGDRLSRTIHMDPHGGTMRHINPSIFSTPLYPMSSDILLGESSTLDVGGASSFGSIIPVPLPPISVDDSQQRPNISVRGEVWSSFVCNHPGCNFAATSKADLAVHTKIHAGERRYKCELGCNYSTSEKGHLVKHSLNHNHDKEFKCEVDGCIYSCATRNGIAIHRKCHTTEAGDQSAPSGDVYKCDFPGCTYSTLKKGNLAPHVRSHSDEKPYKCDHPGCTYAARKSSHLKDHKLIHSGKKPYQCEVDGCNYSCSQKTNMLR